jgi:excisionase family DNA binding protein
MARQDDYLGGIELLDRRQAAGRLKFSTRKLYNETKEGRIPHVRLGRLVRFIPADLDAYVEAHRMGGG